MYVSFAVGVAFAVATYVLIVLFGLNFGPLAILLSIVGVLLVYMPYIGAVSKSIWAHFFFKYESEVAKQVANDRQT